MIHATWSDGYSVQLLDSESNREIEKVVLLTIDYKNCAALFEQLEVKGAPFRIKVNRNISLPSPVCNHNLIAKEGTLRTFIIGYFSHKEPGAGWNIHTREITLPVSLIYVILMRKVSEGWKMEGILEKILSLFPDSGSLTITTEESPAMSKHIWIEVCHWLDIREREGWMDVYVV